MGPVEYEAGCDRDGCDRICTWRATHEGRVIDTGVRTSYGDPVTVRTPLIEAVCGCPDRNPTLAERLNAAGALG